MSWVPAKLLLKVNAELYIDGTNNDPSLISMLLFNRVGVKTLFCFEVE